MTTQYAEEQGFKKKYLAPLIVLMLCAVSLTGAAYAYSTSVTGHGTVDYDWYSIDLYNDDGTVLSKSLSSTDDFDVQTKKTIAPNGETDVKYDYYASVEGKTITFNTNVKVASNNDKEDCLIYGSAAYNHSTSSAAMYGTWASGITCKVSVKATDATEWTEVSDSKAFEGKTGVTYDVKIEVTLPAIVDYDLGTANPVDVEKMTKFVGTDCIEITLLAKNKTA